MTKISGSSPLYRLLNEINDAARGGLPFLAISMTFALPDICVSLISDDGRSDSVRYKEWCKNNLGAEFSYVTPDDLYSMRCGVLHNGRFGDLKHNVSRVAFALPDGNKYANNLFNDVYFYGVVDFCLYFTNAVYKWMEANNDHPNIQKNIPRLMQYRPDGIPPSKGGMPVLA